MNPPRPRIRRLFGLDVARGDRIAAELEDELRLHLDLRAQQLQQRGLTAAQARAAAVARYGSIDDAATDIHHFARRREHRMQRRISFESFVQDVRFALRGLWRNKSWTAVAVITFALGIGASAAVFSVTHNLLFNPLQYPDGGRLVLISTNNTKSNVQISPSNAMVRRWRAAKTIDGIEGVSAGDVTYLLNNEPNTAHVAKVSSTFTTFSGARVLAGRALLPTDVAPGAPPVVVLSEHIWKSRFAGSHDAIGQPFTVNDKRYTIVGVFADGVRTPSYSPDPVELWLPLLPDDNLGGPAVARLAPGATVVQAEQELRTLFMSDPDTKGFRDSGFDIRMQRPGNSVASSTTMYMLSGAVCMLLLIASANVAHLLLARGAARGRELSIRAALGAGQARIARQLVTESLLLACLGCGGGLLIGAGTLRIIGALRPARMSELANIPLCADVALATIAISLVAGVAFGLVSTFGSRGARNFEVLRSSIASTADRRRHRVRSLLVVTESALSVVLLVGAVLLIRTVLNLYESDPGFDADNVFAMTVDLPQSRYGAVATRQLYATRLLDDAKRVPGVADATIASYVPTRTGAQIGDWETDGGAPASAGAGFTPMNSIAPGYFALLRLKLVAGHDFTADSRARGEVIVSRSLARQLFGSGNPIGRRFRQAGSKHTDAWSTITGVTNDAAVLNLRDGKAPAVYYPAEVESGTHLTLIVRMQPGVMPHAALRRVSLAEIGRAHV